MKHTKGPWRVEEIDPIIWSITNNEIVAEANSDVLDSNQVRANAQLIACAPDMLEALLDLVKYIDQNERDTAQLIRRDQRGWAKHNAYYHAALAAIAKATGK